MKKNVLFGIFLSILLMSIFTSCRKEDASELLPPPTIGDTLQTGVAARIADTTWLADSWSVQVKNGFISFTATTDTGETFGFWINASKTGLYTFNTNNQHLAYFKDINGQTYFSNSVESKSNSLLSGGMVNITTYDIDSGIISGSYIFNLYCPENGRSLKISEGAFTNLELLSSSSINTGSYAEITEDQIGSTFQASSDKCRARLMDHNKVSLSFYTTAGSMIEINLPSYSKGTYPVSYTSKCMANYYPKNSRTVYSSGGHQASWGFVTITSIDDSLITGSYSFKIYNPENKKYVLVHSGAFKNVKVENVSNTDNEFVCYVDNKEFISSYITVDLLNEKYKITSYDAKDRPRFMLYFPYSSGEGVLPLMKSNKDAYAVYFDEAGRMYTSGEGSVLVMFKQDSTMIASFKFDADYGNQELISNITEGGFIIKYW